MYINPPIAFYLALCFIVTWITEKLEALPTFISWIPGVYYIMLVILILITLLSSWKAADRERRFEIENR